MDRMANKLSSFRCLYYSIFIVFQPLVNYTQYGNYFNSPRTVSLAWRDIGFVPEYPVPVAALAAILQEAEIAALGR